MPHYLVHDIVWDTQQGDEPGPDQEELDLPSDEHLYHLDSEDQIEQALIDTYGYPVIGYDFQEIESPRPDPMDLAKAAMEDMDGQ